MPETQGEFWDRAVNCQRCGMPCRTGVSTNSAARPFKRGQHGVCAECAVTEFFKSPKQDHGVGFALPSDFDPEGLRMPHIQQQLARVLEVGQSELPLTAVNWDLPVS